MRSARKPSRRRRMRAPSAPVNNNTTPQMLQCRHSSNVEPEVHDIALLDEVLLAFETQLACIARTGFAVAGDVVCERNHLGADEAALEVGVNDCGRLRCSRAYPYGPGP